MQNFREASLFVMGRNQKREARRPTRRGILACRQERSQHFDQDNASWNNQDNTEGEEQVRYERRIEGPKEA